MGRDVARYGIEEQTEQGYARKGLSLEVSISNKL